MLVALAAFFFFFFFAGCVPDLLRDGAVVPARRPAAGQMTQAVKSALIIANAWYVIYGRSSTQGSNGSMEYVHAAGPFYFHKYRHPRLGQCKQCEVGHGIVQPLSVGCCAFVFLKVRFWVGYYHTNNSIEVRNHGEYRIVPQKVLGTPLSRCSSMRLKRGQTSLTPLSLEPRPSLYLRYVVQLLASAVRIQYLTKHSSPRCFVWADPVACICLFVFVTSAVRIQYLTKHSSPRCFVRTDPVVCMYSFLFVTLSL